MSKSRGNVFDPDEQVRAYGADTVRAYLMFGYRWSDGGPWDSENIQGVVRWLHRVWNLIVDSLDEMGETSQRGSLQDLERKLHQTIEHVSRDLERFEFNTVVSALMELTNDLVAARETGNAGDGSFRMAVEDLLLMMAPIAPHLAEELWQRMGNPYSIHHQAWPEYDPDTAREEVITLVLQVNGKVRDRLEVSADIDADEAKRRALENSTIRRYLEGRDPDGVIYVPGRLVNVVISG
jgi:leucyl-tRNA synthetase